ncbi:MAG: hypothetical protein ABEI52_09790, partial [Halobacteriaceae archaeon]
DQVYLGMSSYGSALNALKRLTELGLNGTMAINSNGATPETEDIDLLLWPGADRDFQPMDETTRDTLSRMGFRSATEMTIVDATPARESETIKDQRESPSPIETFIGDTIGRIGAGLIILFGVATVGALLSHSGTTLLHPISGLASIGGVSGALAGLAGVQLAFTSSASAARSSNVAQHDSNPSLLDTNGWQWQQYSAFVGFWLTLSFAFPTIFRLANWPFGATVRPIPALLSASTYGIAILVLALAIYGLLSTGTTRNDRVSDVIAMSVVIGSFVLGLVLVTGLACSLWYGVIGFTTGC